MRTSRQTNTRTNHTGSFTPFLQSLPSSLDRTHSPAHYNLPVLELESSLHYSIGEKEKTKEGLGSGTRGHSKLDSFSPFSKRGDHARLKRHLPWLWKRPLSSTMASNLDHRSSSSRRPSIKYKRDESLVHPDGLEAARLEGKPLIRDHRTRVTRPMRKEMGICKVQTSRMLNQPKYSNK